MVAGRFEVDGPKTFEGPSLSLLGWGRVRSRLTWWITDESFRTPPRLQRLPGSYRC